MPENMTPLAAILAGKGTRHRTCARKWASVFAADIGGAFYAVVDATMLRRHYRLIHSLVRFIKRFAAKEKLRSRKMFTNNQRGELFTDYSDHPRKLVTLNPKLKSTGAGRYQLLSRWWDAYRKQLGLKDFSPEKCVSVMLLRLMQNSTKELADAKAENDALRDDVAAGRRRLHIKAVSCDESSLYSRINYVHSPDGESLSASAWNNKTDADTGNITVPALVLTPLPRKRTRRNWTLRDAAWKDLW
ncbi:hypothetical protein OIU74_022201 [Salix koriyanagi]|uniref:Uncharacterized protein n=1 Tax=Salix koriyanagi TaxID=2511006 RepID=A0A9Q1AEQ6_9ROSI|nr:hypothetical protein OIU74_022201 [Salix koriyanagi]